MVQKECNANITGYFHKSLVTCKATISAWRITLLNKKSKICVQLNFVMITFSPSSLLLSSHDWYEELQGPPAIVLRQLQTANWRFSLITGLEVLRAHTSDLSSLCLVVPVNIQDMFKLSTGGYLDLAQVLEVVLPKFCAVLSSAFIPCRVFSYLSFMSISQLLV